MRKLCHCAVVPVCSFCAGRKEKLMTNEDEGKVRVNLPSFGVYGCGVNPGCAMYFWRTSRIFSWRLCLLGKMSLCPIWGGNWFSSVKLHFVCEKSHLKTVCRLSRWEHSVFLEQLHHKLSSLLENLSVALLVRIVGCCSLRWRLGRSRRPVGIVFGCENSVDAICKHNKELFRHEIGRNLHLSWSMLKSGPKKRFPIRKEAADGVADDMALRSDCSSSVGAEKCSMKFWAFSRKLSTHQLLSMAAVFCDNFAWRHAAMMARKSHSATDNLRAWIVGEIWTYSQNQLDVKHWKEKSW